jgi:4-alpha-glucanotransferase
MPGPGAEFFHAVRKELGVLPFIAEDLGLITPDVSALRDEFNIPGTRVLQFAFDARSDNPHLPANFSTNTVVYTGTHDNNTTRGWFEALSETVQGEVRRYLNQAGCDGRKIAGELLRVAWGSVAALAIAPVQDLLNLGAGARMNLPGSAEANWCWRLTEDMLSTPVFQRLRDLTASSHRLRGARTMPAAKTAAP